MSILTPPPPPSYLPLTTTYRICCPTLHHTVVLPLLLRIRVHRFVATLLPATAAPFALPFVRSDLPTLYLPRVRARHCCSRCTPALPLTHTLSLRLQLARLFWFTRAVCSPLSRFYALLHWLTHTAVLPLTFFAFCVHIQHRVARVSPAAHSNDLDVVAPFATAFTSITCAFYSAAFRVTPFHYYRFTSFLTTPFQHCTQFVGRTFVTFTATHFDLVYPLPPARCAHTRPTYPAWTTFLVVTTFLHSLPPPGSPTPTCYQFSYLRSTPRTAAPRTGTPARALCGTLRCGSYHTHPHSFPCHPHRPPFTPHSCARRACPTPVADAHFALPFVPLVYWITDLPARAWRCWLLTGRSVRPRLPADAPLPRLPRIRRARTHPHYPKLPTHRTAYTITPIPFLPLRFTPLLLPSLVLYYFPMQFAFHFGSHVYYTFERCG